MNSAMVRPLTYLPVLILFSPSHDDVDGSNNEDNDNYNDENYNDDDDDDDDDAAATK